VPADLSEQPRMPLPFGEEAESTIRDRVPSALLPSSPPKFATTKPPKVDKKK